MSKQRHHGPAIGSHLGKPIFQFIENRDGRYVFDRLAECDDEGCPLDQVKKGELLLHPGLIYRKVS